MNCITFCFSIGLLHVGDIIKEINGIDVTNDPDALQEHMKSADGNVTLKILPSYRDHIPAPPVSMAFVEFYLVRPGIALKSMFLIYIYSYKFIRSYTVSRSS